MEGYKLTISFQPGSETQKEIGVGMLDVMAKTFQSFLTSKHKDNKITYEVEVLPNNTVQEQIEELNKEAEKIL